MTKISTPSHPVFLRATGSGIGGIATLILDGWGLIAAFQPLLKAKQPLLDTPFNKLVYGRLQDGAGRMIDEVIVTLLDNKETTTGHEQIELSCHGGEGAVLAVEEALLAAGFVRARGTELLERAHLNGKLSLIALEARLALAQCVTARQAAFLLGHGELQQRWEKFGYEMAFGMRSRETSWREPLYQAAGGARERARAGRALLSRHTVAILGPVNAGKSTLSNRLARMDRHLVSPLPGTTRDRLDTPLELRGLNVVLTDTAGLRETSEELEREGQRRAADAAAAADLRLVLLDGSQPPGAADVVMLKQAAALGPVLLALNKWDLGLNEEAEGLGFLAGVEPVAFSARSGEGVEVLESALENALLGPTAPEPGDPFTLRQMTLLEEMEAGLKDGGDAGELLDLLRRLVGTRPDPKELAVVLKPDPE